VKFVVLEALPPFVVTAIFPVVAPVGTVAVISVSEITEGLTDFRLKNVTFVACSRPVPLMVTVVPTGPVGGLNELIVGVTLKVVLLVSVPNVVVTVTGPVSASEGTVALMNVVPMRVTEVASTPPNFTADELPKPWPSMPILACSLPKVVFVSTNGPRP